MLLSAPASVPLRASGATRQEVLDAVEPLASALSQGDVNAFLSGVAPDAPVREELRAAVSALIAFAEVTSSVDVLSIDGDRAELDWYMQIRARATGAIAERRREAVSVRLAKRKLAEISPVRFFVPPSGLG